MTGSSHHATYASSRRWHEGDAHAERLEHLRVAAIGADRGRELVVVRGHEHGSLAAESPCDLLDL